MGAVSRCTRSKSCRRISDSFTTRRGGSDRVWAETVKEHAERWAAEDAAKAASTDDGDDEDDEDETEEGE